MKLWRLLAGMVLAAWPATACLSQAVPHTRAQALDGSTVTFPEDSGGKPLLLVLSFSHKGETSFTAWTQHLKPSYLHDERVSYYELTDFEGVPSFVMSFILHGMRRSVPADEHASFALLRSDSKAWRTLVGYDAPKEAYVVVADRQGRVLWQAHGAVTEERLAEIAKVIDDASHRPGSD